MFHVIATQYFDYWRIGLRWDVFPDKLWENRTVPYVISALYGMKNFVVFFLIRKTNRE